MSEPDWKRYGYPSYEAFIESKAGACPPPDWPQPKPPPFAADDENKAEPDE